MNNLKIFLQNLNWCYNNFFINYITIPNVMLVNLCCNFFLRINQNDWK
jgi:hypothetical protein